MNLDRRKLLSENENQEIVECKEIVHLSRKLLLCQKTNIYTKQMLRYGPLERNVLAETQTFTGKAT